jgi:hypothetical protein
MFPECDGISDNRRSVLVSERAFYPSYDAIIAHMLKCRYRGMRHQGPRDKTSYITTLFLKGSGGGHQNPTILAAKNVPFTIDMQPE